MAHLEDWEIDALKQAHPLAEVVRSDGHELKKHGTKKLACLCPFHEEKTPSCVIDTVRNTFKCFGCGKSGDVIAWLRETRGVTFPEAMELLQGTDGEGKRKKEKGKSEEQSQSPTGNGAQRWRFEPEMSDGELLREVTAYYHATAKASPEVRAFLEKRGLWTPEVIDVFQLGYANRTLGYHLPPKERAAGQRIRTRLQDIGILRESGHEHLNGSLVVPLDSSQLSAVSFQPEVVQLYGRKLRDDLRQGTPKHLYLAGPLKGVFNALSLGSLGSPGSPGSQNPQSSVLSPQSLIVCEAILDALTFWVHGFRNVTACYGVNGLTEELLHFIVALGIKEVLLAFDSDEAGDRGAAAVAERLSAHGIACRRVRFPHGLDANDYALKAVSQQPSAFSPTQALQRLLETATELSLGRLGSLGGLERPGSLGSPEPEKPEGRSQPAERKNKVAAPNLACDSQDPQDSQDSPDFRQGLPSPQSGSLSPEVVGEDVFLNVGDRRYRVRGLAKNLSPGCLKVNLRVTKGDGLHLDTLDLCSHKQREQFARVAAPELGFKPEVIERDLKRVLAAAEDLQDAQIAAALNPKPKVVELTEDERAAALDFLRQPDVVERVVADFKLCGVVGEETNLLTGYLGAVSRLLEKPLGILIQSSSAAGKTSLMEAVLAMLPKEAKVKYSALTGQSLYYMGDLDLRHKVLAIAEEEGARKAGFSLKLLQSDGELTIASTGKDARTGRLSTHEYEVKGPVMLFSTTTAIELDEELVNRCIVLTVNEDREQTRAIHRQQRERYTVEGLWARDDAARVKHLHRNAQKLLRALDVVNPFARDLTFLDDKTRTRRDHDKYLTLINAIALLHQQHRPVRETLRDGELKEYICVTVADIALANRLANEVLGRSLDELPPQTRRLLLQLDAWVTAECARLGLVREDFHFTQRMVREALGWGNTQVKIHLGRLLELEYLLPHRGGRGQQFVYELLYDGGGQDGKPFLMGLIDPAKLHVKPEYDANRAGFSACLSGSSRGQNGTLAAGCRSALSQARPGENGNFSEMHAQIAQPASAAPLRSHLGSDR